MNSFNRYGEPSGYDAWLDRELERSQREPHQCEGCRHWLEDGSCSRGLAALEDCDEREVQP